MLAVRNAISTVLPGDPHPCAPALCSPQRSGTCQPRSTDGGGMMLHVDRPTVRRGEVIIADGRRLCENMVRPQAESITIDKRDIVLQSQCTGTLRKPGCIGDCDQLGVVLPIATSCSQQVTDRFFTGESISLSCVLRLNQGRGVLSAAVL